MFVGHAGVRLVTAGLAALLEAPAVGGEPVACREGAVFRQQARGAGAPSAEPLAKLDAREAGSSI